MNKHRMVLAAAVWLAAVAVGRADTVRKVDGRSVTGDVVQTTPQEITVVDRGGARTAIPVNEIQRITFSDEQAALGTARTAIEAGRYEDAVGALERINLAEVKRAVVQQDIQFFLALAKARLALASSDPAAVVEAGKQMVGFVTANPQSYHYLAACEVVGDLLVAAGKYAAAQEYYGRVAGAPWPEYKMRANVAMGRALLAEGKPGEAQKCFQTVLDTNAQGPVAESQRLAATLGKGRCLAEAGQTDEAIKLIEEVIARIDPEQTQLQAQAYNALGLAHRKAGHVQDALLAYLHVDVLYFNAPKEHVEALENLVELWGQVQQPDRAEEATQKLQERYKRGPRSK